MKIYLFFYFIFLIITILLQEFFLNIYFEDKNILLFYNLSLQNISIFKYFYKIKFYTYKFITRIKYSLIIIL